MICKAKDCCEDTEFDVDELCNNHWNNTKCEHTYQFSEFKFHCKKCGVLG